MCHGPSSHQLHVWLLDLPSQQLHVYVMAAGSSLSPCMAAGHQLHDVCVMAAGSS